MNRKLNSNGPAMTQDLLSGKTTILRLIKSATIAWIGNVESVHETYSSRSKDRLIYAHMPLAEKGNAGIVPFFARPIYESSPLRSRLPRGWEMFYV